MEIKTSDNIMIINQLRNQIISMSKDVDEKIKTVHNLISLLEESYKLCKEQNEKEHSYNRQSP